MPYFKDYKLDKYEFQKFIEWIGWYEAFDMMEEADGFDDVFQQFMDDEILEHPA